MAYNGSLLYSIAEKHKTMPRLMTEINKYKQIIEFNAITAIEYSSCYKTALLWEFMKKYNYGFIFGAEVL